MDRLLKGSLYHAQVTVCSKPKQLTLAGSYSEFLGRGSEVLWNKGVMLDRHESRRLGSEEGKVRFPERVLSAGIKSMDV